MVHAGLRSSAPLLANAVGAARRSGQRAFKRSLHTRKELPYKIEDGLGGFMSPETLRTVAVEYQDGLLTRLNEQVRNTSVANASVAQTVLDTAMAPDMTLAYSYASHALNNSFFLNCLKPPSDIINEDVETSNLNMRIREEFGAIDHFKSLFSSTALGMSGSGYVWLVTDPRCNLAILPTFAAGTLLVRSRAGTDDPRLENPVLGEELGSRHAGAASPLGSTASAGAAPTSPVSGVSHQPPPLHPSSPARSISSVSNIYGATRMAEIDYDFKKLGDVLLPLLCLSVHEHCWLRDFGVWGKEAWLREFWNVVNWEHISKRFDALTPRQSSFGSWR